MQVAIIGAGLCGLTVARLLDARGAEVTVVDKSYVVGGRMATRSVGGGVFDHGAQHFSARDPRFVDEVDRWKRAGVADVWFESQSVTHPERGVEPRHRGIGGMRRIAEFLSRDVDVRTQWQVERLQADSTGKYVVISSDGAAVTVDAVVVTPPVPQVGAILRRSDVALTDAEAAMLDGVRYDATLAVLARAAGPALESGHLAPDDGGPVAWIGDNLQKGISPEGAVTVHSTAGFAAEHLESDPAQWVGVLVEHGAELAGVPLEGAHAHRWRFSQPVNPLDVGALRLHAAPVVVAGEAFAAARVEGAFLSGVAAADAVMAM